MTFGVVPDTDNFALSDVVDGVIIPSPASLSACFAAANPAGFDPNYVGNKDRLSNFRNYIHAGQPDISIDVTSRSVGQRGTTFTINVTSNAAWTSAVTDAWISRSPTSGSGNTAVSVTVAQNDDGFSRMGTISFSVTGKTVSCTINQDG